MIRQQINIGYEPREFQRRIHEQAKRFTVVVAHRRFGKTLASVAALVDAALAPVLPNSRFAYVAPFLKQAKRAAWDYLKAFANKIPMITIREGELSVDFPNGSRISLYGADNPEGMRGIYLDGVVLDEMADFRPDVWGSIIRPTLSDRKGWAMFIGTPKGINQFSELYFFATAEKEPDWIGMMFRVDETGLIDEEELRSSRAVMSDSQYRQEWLCDFSASADNTLITIDIVSASTKKTIIERDVEGLPKIIGVDVARFGDDRSVIQRRHGLYAFDPIVRQGVDNMDLAAELMVMIDEWKPDAVFVDAGRGEGVIDRLRQMGYSPIEINFGGRPIDSSYTNKRSEMWDTMAKWFTAGGRIPNHGELKTDLCVPTYKFDAQNRFMLESKDDIKKRGMRSPDLGDALALTFALPIAPQTVSMRPRRVAHSDWHPFPEDTLDRRAPQLQTEWNPYRE